MVSIGKPHVAEKLIDHLDTPSLRDYLYVDPDNVLYDALHLNFGVKETFFSIETAFAFLNRFKKQGGMNEILEVLPKWGGAIFIPPKQKQAFNQGGTFVFDGDQTILAHYDASTGAHSEISQVLSFAKARASPRMKALSS